MKLFIALFERFIRCFNTWICAANRSEVDQNKVSQISSENTESTAPAHSCWDSWCVTLRRQHIIRLVFVEHDGSQNLQYKKFVICKYVLLFATLTLYNTMQKS